MNKSAFRKAAALSFLAAMSTFSAFAQEEPKVFGGAKQFNTWSIGANVGITTPKVMTGGQNYYPDTDFNFGYGFYLQKSFTHSFALKADYQGTKLTASYPAGNPQIKPPYESYSQKVNYAFSIQPVIDLTALLLHREPKFSVYVQGGAGIMGYQTTNTNPNVTQDKNSVAFYPVGGGLKYRIDSRWTLDLGYTMNFMDAGDANGATWMPENNKWSYGHVGVNYSLGKKTKKNLDWVNPYALMYDELKDDELRREVEVLKTRVAASEAQIKELYTDTDGDGVSDVFDKDNNTPKGTQVTGSGVAIVFPQPPPPPVQQPVAAPAPQEIGRIQFEFNSAKLTPSSKSATDALAKEIKGKNLKVTVNGYASIEGTEEYNLELSQRRADAVKAELVKAGASASSIMTKGYGTAHPVASNDTEAGREKNRRVEIIVQ